MNGRCDTAIQLDRLDKDVMNPSAKHVVPVFYTYRGGGERHASSVPADIDLVKFFQGAM